MAIKSACLEDQLRMGSHGCSQIIRLGLPGAAKTLRAGIIVQP